MNGEIKLTNFLFGSRDPTYISYGNMGSIGLQLGPLNYRKGIIPYFTLEFLNRKKREGSREKQVNTRRDNTRITLEIPSQTLISSTKVAAHIRHTCLRSVCFRHHRVSLDVPAGLYLTW